MKVRIAIGLVLLLTLLAVWLPSGDDRDQSPVRPGSGEPEESPLGETPAPSEEAEAENDSDTASTNRSDLSQAPYRTTGGVPGFFLNLAGTVVDAVTLKPIEGARVLSVRVSPDGSDSYGDDTSRYGRFKFTEWKSEHRNGATRFVLRVSAAGYEPVEVVPDLRDVTVELIPLGRPLLPGTIVGRAVDEDLRPLSGCVGIETRAGEEESRYHVVLADAQGRFELPGMAPGACRVRVEYSSERPEIWVPEGGTVRVEVVSTEPAPSTPAARTRAGVAKRIEELLSEEMTCSMFLSQPSRLTHAERGPIIEKLRKARVERRWLQLRYRDLLGARTLVVTGLPDEGVAVLRAHLSPEYWCVAVAKGRARLPSLRPGLWKLILQRPGKPNARRWVRITEGKGPQTYAWK